MGDCLPVIALLLDYFHIFLDLRIFYRELEQNTQDNEGERIQIAR